MFVLSFLLFSLMIIKNENLRGTSVLNPHKQEIHYKYTNWQHFQDLLTEISSRLISLPVTDIDGVLEETQKQVCEALGIDLSSLWQPLGKEHDTMVLTHFHTTPGGPQKPDKIDASATFPWVYKTLQEVDHHAHSTDELRRRPPWTYGRSSSMA